jgi:hypothetical protein
MRLSYAGHFILPPNIVGFVFCDLPGLHDYRRRDEGKVMFKDALADTQLSGEYGVSEMVGVTNYLCYRQDVVVVVIVRSSCTSDLRSGATVTPVPFT